MSSVSAKEVYDCDFFGPNYLLTIEDNDLITLKNGLRTFDCEKSLVYFPGTELELKVLNCTSSLSKKVFYYTFMDNGDIILSPNLGISRDFTCKHL